MSIFHTRRTVISFFTYILFKCFLTVRNHDDTDSILSSISSKMYLQVLLQARRLKTLIVGLLSVGVVCNVHSSKWIYFISHYGQLTTEKISNNYKVIFFNVYVSCHKVRIPIVG